MLIQPVCNINYTNNYNNKKNNLVNYKSKFKMSPASYTKKKKFVPLIKNTKKTLEYISKNIKIQKKIAYENSDKYISAKRKILADEIKKREEEARLLRWKEMDEQEKLNKENVFKEYLKTTKDFIVFIGELIIEPFIETYKDLRKELSLLKR